MVVETILEGVLVPSERTLPYFVVQSEVLQVQGKDCAEGKYVPHQGQNDGLVPEHLKDVLSVLLCMIVIHYPHVGNFNQKCEAESSSDECHLLCFTVEIRTKQIFQSVDRIGCRSD